MALFLKMLPFPLRSVAPLFFTLLLAFYRKSGEKGPLTVL
ncbi:Hypothetical protein Minf_0727 [Methylacidiphilum infernorum V4]|uniref:Uncharacterized protein n=1 Tax=Methylacidiphilum infernorum (isolate V4) TaxID=481448 RepID=B3E0M8_METI4|nr:Hypothetical protein Minf_0727 [Methylacidiphilum infernorum V4]